MSVCPWDLVVQGCYLSHQGKSSAYTLFFFKFLVLFCFPSAREIASTRVGNRYPEVCPRARKGEKNPRAIQI